jgi:hypothetical protein
VTTTDPHTHDAEATHHATRSNLWLGIYLGITITWAFVAVAAGIAELVQR